MACLILALSIRIGKSVLLYFDRDLPKIYLQVGLSACLFIGPFLYFYLKAALENIPTLPSRWKTILIMLLVSIVTVGLIRPYATYPDFWNTYVVQSIYSIWFVSVLFAGFTLLPVFKKALSKELKVSPVERWLCVIFIGNAVIAGAFFLSFFGSSMAYYISGPLVFSFFLYLLAYGYFNRNWFEMKDIPVIEKYANRKIKSSEAEAIIDKLNHLMHDKAVYTNPHLKLDDLAEDLDISKHQLSQLLNDNLGKPYKTFINEYRIQAACNMMASQHNLSLEGIGYEVGFRSKSTFFTTFKRMKNLTPAKYQEKIGV